MRSHPRTHARTFCAWARVFSEFAEANTWPCLMAHCRYRTLPHREEILRGVLGADLVGFHIYDYARHFHTACSRVLGTGGAEGVTEGNEGIFDHASRRSIAVDGA
jgi:hypothetical protein